MENFKRKLFFWSLVLLFFIVAPVTVLNARGYRFDIGRGVFVYSGAINLKANPQNFQVAINGQPNDSKQLNRINNSYNISGLLPGDYEIKLSQDGYNSWTKKTDVHSGVSSEFWNILLIREEYERTAYDAENVDRFFVSPKNNLIAYTENAQSGLEVKLFDFNSEKTEKALSFPEWRLLSEDRKENIEWSPEEDHLSIPVEKDVEIVPIVTTPVLKKALLKKEEPKTEKKYAYFVANVSDATSFNLNEFLERDNIRDIRWDPEDKDYLFFLDGTDLFRTSIVDKNDLSLISSDVAAFNLSSAGIYFVTAPNNLAFRTSLNGKSDKNQITSFFPEVGNKIDRIIVYDDDRIAFIDSNKNLFVYNKGEKDTYFRKIGTSVEGLHFSDDGKKMLFWSNYEISVYFARDWLVQPTRSENEISNITRYSEIIKNVQWFKDYEHIIFSTGRWTKIIELDGRDHRNSADLINVNLDNPFIRYNNFLEKLYFTYPEGDKTVLESINFPEPTPFLGIGG
jgi:hypothetical protein